MWAPLTFENDLEKSKSRIKNPFWRAKMYWRLTPQIAKNDGNFQSYKLKVILVAKLHFSHF